MGSQWNGEVLRHDGVGVDKQREVLVDVFLHLLLRSVLLAQEARTLRYGLLVDACSCRHNARRVELKLQREFATA